MTSFKYKFYCDIFECFTNFQNILILFMYMSVNKIFLYLLCKFYFNLIKMYFGGEDFRLISYNPLFMRWDLKIIFLS